jgi:hypothetical protein
MSCVTLRDAYRAFFHKLSVLRSPRKFVDFCSTSVTKRHTEALARKEEAAP